MKPASLRTRLQYSYAFAFLQQWLHRSRRNHRTLSMQRRLEQA